MSSNSDDIQAAGSDTRPPMLDRTDYESWSQRIRLYCRGKENGLQVLQSIDQGPFELGTTRDSLGTTPKGGVLLGPERPRFPDILQLSITTLTAKKQFGQPLNQQRSERDKSLNLKQHEKHVAQDRLIIERITPSTNDPLAFVSSVQPYSQPSQSQSHQYQSSTTPPQSQNVQSIPYSQFAESSSPDSGYTQTKEILNTLSKQFALLTQSFRATLLQTNNQLRTSSNTRNQATIQDGQIVVQNVQGRQNQNQRNFARGNGAAGFGGMQNRVGNANAGQGKPFKCYNCNGVGHIARNCTQPKRPHNSDYFKDKMLLMQAQENGAVLDEEELLFLAGEQGNTFDADVDNQPVQDLALNEDNIFQADECDAFDSDVDDEPTAQTIFMANLSSAGSANPQAGPSNASILSECLYGIPYEQYLSVNNISVVPSCASSTLNNVFVSSDNDAFVSHDPIANELKIYKEQVAIYEQRAKFELTEREQRMDDQMRMLIQNRNKMEENLKKELHSVKLQLNSTMENNKIFEETVTTLKHKFKQKESKFLTDFFNLKHLNDKLENKLHSQDQSI
ncbi:retrovirus-related pol polyprotein from transposon TNT 1-94 [Tanacetum coccineum]